MPFRESSLSSAMAVRRFFHRLRPSPGHDSPGETLKFATKLTLSTLMAGAVSALVVPPAHADGGHTEQLNSQFQPSTRTRAEVAAEAREANRLGHLAARTVDVVVPALAQAPAPRKTATR